MEFTASAVEHGAHVPLAPEPLAHHRACQLAAVFRAMPMILSTVHSPVRRGTATAVLLGERDAPPVVLARDGVSPHIIHAFALHLALLESKLELAHLVRVTVLLVAASPNARRQSDRRRGTCLELCTLGARLRPEVLEWRGRTRVELLAVGIVIF